ncbi:hypothetical protein TNIN_244721 [Trichonephila inaurata madagascariensis]|uniref:Uncharacterized protein n=1 Tax=Trichonephila inaurata madagascariensis TaxID=2747483 RepID=A0A8X7CHM7_9ARAC|nr:hypothetical protein TNIN_244721 [Trichonephila inaurata madagascariensis]
MFAPCFRRHAFWKGKLYKESLTMLGEATIDVPCHLLGGGEKAQTAGPISFVNFRPGRQEFMGPSTKETGGEEVFVPGLTSLGQHGRAGTKSVNRVCRQCRRGMQMFVYLPSVLVEKSGRLSSSQIPTQNILTEVEMFQDNIYLLYL